MNGALFRHRLVFHAGIFKHVCPLAAGAGMAVFEVLAEVIGAEKLLRLVALAKLMDNVKVFRANFPARRVGELFTTVAADIRTVAGHGLVEGGFRAGESGA